MPERSPHEQEGTWMKPEDAARIQAALEEARRARQSTPHTQSPISFNSGRPRQTQPPAPSRPRTQGQPTSFQPSRPAPKPVAESYGEASGSKWSVATEHQFSDGPNVKKKTASPEDKSHRRHPRVYVVGAVIVASLVTVGATAKTDVLKDLPFAGKYIEQGIGSFDDVPATDAAAIETVGAEGLTLQNCQEDGSAVATITVSGRYPLKYLLKSPDGTQDVIPEPYLTPEAYLPGPILLTTESGFPELELKDFPVSLSVCAKETLSGQVISQLDDETTIDLNQLDIKASIPDDYTSVVFNGEDGVKETSNHKPTLVWSASSYLKPNATEYTDVSVTAAEAAHTALAGEVSTQAAAALNASIDAILQMAMQAPSTSEMNEKCDFSGDNKNTAQVLKQGISQRIVGDPDRVEFANAIQNIGGTMFKKDPPVLVDNPANLAERFIIDSCSVVVGDSVAAKQSGEKS